jgi:hypothetical protein
MLALLNLTTLLLRCALAFFRGRRDQAIVELDRWLSVTMDIEGLPTPYWAPNANPHIERSHRTLREDALNHFLPGKAQ